MHKVFSLLKRKEGMSREEFYHWATQDHPKYGEALPGIRGYRMSLAVLDGPESLFDAIAELWFDDAAAYETAFASPQGAAAREDALAHASQRIHLHTEEFIFV